MYIPCVTPKCLVINEFILPSVFLFYSDLESFDVIKTFEQVNSSNSWKRLGELV